MLRRCRAWFSDMSRREAVQMLIGNGAAHDAPQTKAQLKVQFVRRAKLLHPDKPGGSKEQMQRLIQAYKVLSSSAVIHPAEGTDGSQADVASPVPARRSWAQRPPIWMPWSRRAPLTGSRTAPAGTAPASPSLITRWRLRVYHFIRHTTRSIVYIALGK